MRDFLPLFFWLGLPAILLTGMLFGVKTYVDNRDAKQRAWEETHCEYKTVSTVGGCNRWGVCTVRFADGTFGADLMPIAGGAAKWCDYKDMP